MAFLIAAIVSWSATAKVALEPQRNPSEGHVYVRGEKVRFEHEQTVAVWNGKVLRVRVGTHPPAVMDPSLRAAFGIVPTCLEKCGYAMVGEEMRDNILYKMWSHTFAKTPMGPLKQTVWLGADGLPRVVETRSARGVTRMQLHPIAGKVPAKLFTSP